jgi:diguanylate cyclase (GGDEF)-like protein
LSILQFISDQIAMAIDKVKSVEEMHYLAYYDKMTKLPNRTLFNDRAKIAFKNAARNKEKYVVLFLDLDEFKIVNDTMGHNAGDQLLKTISKRIVKSVREGDTISHWGGDEFTILSKIKNIDDNKLLCERILKNIKEKIIINRRRVNCTVSIGGAIYPNDGDNIDDLVQKADMAMYVSKTQGKDKYTLYNDEINEKMLEKLNLEIEVRKKLHQINKQ